MSLVQESLAGSSLEEVHGVVHLAEAIAKCNERFSRLVGFDAAALMGKSLLELCPELQADGAFSAERWKRRWQAARAGLPQWFPWQFRNRQGRRVHALINLSLDPDDPGRVVANVHDLSNLGQSGWIRPDSRARLQQVLDHTKAIIIVKDLAGRYVFANREFERATRMPAERVVGYTDNELWPPEHVAQFVSHDTEVFATRTRHRIRGHRDHRAASARRSSRGSFRCSSPTASRTRSAASRPTSRTASARRTR